MKNKVVILSSGHPPKDERLFSKIGYSLTANGYSVVISTSTEDFQAIDSSILFDCFDGEKLTKRKKINKFFSVLSTHSPDIIISSEPLPIIAGYQFKKHGNASCILISDITEWYPENVVSKYRKTKKWFSYFVLSIFNFYAVTLCDALVIGEEKKKKRYDVIAPFKPKEIVSYFPRLELFPLSDKTASSNEINLGFTGILNESRGFLRLLTAAAQLREKHHQLKIKLTIVGKFLTHADEKLFSNWKVANPSIEVNFSTWLSYEQLSSKLDQVDIFLDLREVNFVFNNSLPIKIFEYMALGKPVIYSQCSSLQHFFNDFSFGKLVNPNAIDEVISAIEYYLCKPEEMKREGLLGRALVEQRYNWNTCEIKLRSFIRRLQAKLSAEK